MLSQTYSATMDGVQGSVVQVEAYRGRAKPGIHITGLPGTVVRESRDRIEAALGSLGFDVPSKG